MPAPNIITTENRAGTRRLPMPGNMLSTACGRPSTRIPPIRITGEASRRNVPVKKASHRSFGDLVLSARATSSHATSTTIVIPA